MIYLKLAVPLFSFLLLAAHSLRMGDTGWFIIWLTLPLFTLSKSGWARIVLKYALVWAAFIWGLTSYILINMRFSSGMQWQRLSIIMLTTFTAIILSNFILSSRKVKEKFSDDSDKSLPLALIFIITFTSLEILRVKVPLKIILLERFVPGYGVIEIFLLSLYAVWMGKNMLNPSKTSRYRGYIWALFSGIFFLQLILGLAGIEKMLMTGKLHLPVPALIIAGPLYRGSSFFMPVLFLSTVLLAGPAWCSHLCYMGAWDDRMSRLKKGKIIQNPKWAWKARTGILVLVVAVPIILNIMQVPAIKAVIAGAVFGFIGVIVMAVISSRRGTMVHCTVYCPIGLAADILGKISPWRIRINADCNSCGRCTSLCRYNALNREHLDRKKPGLNCTLCGDCIQGCRENQISYHFPGLTADKARVAFIVLMVILHTIFLGVARI